VAHPYPLASVFTEGMRRDIDRAMMPGGAVWNLVDFIPDELAAAASGRGGWTYAGDSLTAATRIQSLSYAPFTAGGKLLAIDQQPKLWDVEAATSITGTPTIPAGPPAYHRGNLIIPNNDGTTAVTYYDGTTLGVLSGSPPAGKLAAVYKDHAILANSAANPNRLWFSGAGDPTSWDINFGWWDTTGDVVAVGSLLNAILIFHADSVERLRGTTPPPGSDMTLEPFLGYGCLDPFSVVSWRNRLVFCSSEGIYMTDGATDVDITASAQMKTYWQTLMEGYSSSWRVSAGVYRDHYIVSINNGTTLVDCLCVNLVTQSMWRLTNLHGSAFVNVTSSLQEECFMGMWNAGRVAQLSSLWSPSSAVKLDGDGTVPTPIIETGAFRGYDRLHRRWIQSMGKQKWRFVYVDHDLRDSGGDDPVLTMSFATTPTGAYANVTGGSLPATSDFTRKRRSLSPTQGGAARSNMLCLKAAVTGPYASAKLYTLEVDYGPIGVGQL
jgi:hypothetical protein